MGGILGNPRQVSFAPTSSVPTPSNRDTLRAARRFRARATLGLVAVFAGCDVYDQALIGTAVGPGGHGSGASAGTLPGAGRAGSGGGSAGRISSAGGTSGVGGATGGASSAGATGDGGSAMTGGTGGMEGGAGEPDRHLRR